MPGNAPQDSSGHTGSPPDGTGKSQDKKPIPTMDLRYTLKPRLGELEQGVFKNGDASASGIASKAAEGHVKRKNVETLGDVTKKDRDEGKGPADSSVAQNYAPNQVRASSTAEDLCLPRTH
ncbi:hypothetical protein LTR10_021084 [Elasticomyces elasticus]|uniref:Uncharacterized protein n=1 Tax=Exophiala sideris TaxID=1016849 RepID=A0ABR0J6F9_9EURO|nr:hypothetical protein LTR10_021084 [Elasticomyces elasticus]KAK5028882.1 hypothetical protein LTS07_006262 [Exophiala sideris]KAK5035751.1 hypothetical protein LTR13_005881 [Exophiala sideris]KAK5057386.1 hypothetical protein LTR69_007426 [Exophiala sideris]KAK5181639.1 hypothetical protein LTR44_005838 [Eurotiomycetes sp. CCFEE 6388]